MNKIILCTFAAFVLVIYFEESNGQYPNQQRYPSPYHSYQYQNQNPNFVNRPPPPPPPPFNQNQNQGGRPYSYNNYNNYNNRPNPNNYNGNGNGGNQFQQGNNNGQRQKPGNCPPSDGSIGLCVFDPNKNCLSDQSCPNQMKCCSEGCGSICKNAIFY